MAETQSKAAAAKEAELDAEGDTAVVVENPTVATGELVWLRHGNGVAHQVAVGSEAHARLVEAAAATIDGPTDEESKVTDFAMVEKAKADARPGR